MESMAFFGVFAFIYGLIMIAFLGLWIWGFILFVKVANRGIKALDIYIRKNNNGTQL